jgi:hypothetical protein
MAQLTFYCPYTNKPIDSGFEIDSREAMKVAQYPIHLRCPHCNLLHHGTVADGRIVPEPDVTTARRKPAKNH